MNPVMRSLPPVLVVHSEDAKASAQLNALARVMLAEYESGAAGQQGVLDRLAEVMFVLILRHHAEHTLHVGGLLGALRHPKLSRALEALHGDPAQLWTVGSLALAAGMSRTSFAERFNAVLGETPMHYLTGWRMQLADTALRHGDKSVAQIAGEVGYETEAAFRRVFKRWRGVGPGSVRRGAAGRAGPVA
jgi:AraC-like DNA-binding protein